MLPRWRGAAPIQRAILAGDATTGVTIMRMEAGLGHRPHLAQRARSTSSPLDTAGSLHDGSPSLGGELICLTLDELAEPAASVEVPQPQIGVTYAEKISKTEALIDWQRGCGTSLAPHPGLQSLARRGNAPRRRATAHLGGEARARCRVARRQRAAPGTVLDATADGIDVACGQGVLRIVRLQLAGRKPLAAHEFIKARPLGGAQVRQRMNEHGRRRAFARRLCGGAGSARGRDSRCGAARMRSRAAPAALAPSVRSLSFGAVRGYYRHEAMLGRLLSQPVRSLDFLVRALLSVALFELEDARTPEYAVVDAAVETAKATDAARAAGLINAVLRRYLRERKTLDAEIARSPATRHASPVWLADRLRADWPVRWTQLLAAGDAQAPMWLRVNSRQSHGRGVSASAARAGIGARAEARVPQAVVLDTPCDVHELPGFAEGVVSVQDLGAQCVAFPLGLGPGQRVLDACAAPGGKTALIAEREPELAKLVAVDIDPQRLARVRENLERGQFAGRARQRRCGRAGGVVGWGAVRSHSARRTLLRARRDPPASRYPSAQVPVGYRQIAPDPGAPVGGGMALARARRAPGLRHLHADPQRKSRRDRGVPQAGARRPNRSGRGVAGLAGIGRGG